MSRPRGSAKKNTEGRRSKKVPVVLVFAESTNDSNSIKILVEHFAAELHGRLSIETRKDPPSLTRAADRKAVQTWLEKVTKLVRTETNLRDVHAILVHRDADYLDSEHQEEQRLKEQLREHLASHVPTERLHPIVPVQELESWWLLFPDAIRAVKPEAWRELKSTEGDTAKVTNPKEKLQEATRKAAKTRGKRSGDHEYRESDSPEIARQIVEILRRGGTASGRNASWDRFLDVAASL